MLRESFRYLLTGMLAKADVTERQVNTFLSNKFGLTLSKPKGVLAGECTGELRRSNYGVFPGRGAHSRPDRRDLLQRCQGGGRRCLTLRHDFKTCRPKILDSGGHPRTTGKCAPDFFPYVADPKRNNQLMTIIGTHDYAAFGQRYTEGFSPPFEQKLPATFFVFPPKARVTLVRVDDFDIVYNEQREVMSGVYLSVVNVKVVDRIYGCDFDKNCVCVLRGAPVARLLDSGKFERLWTQ